MRSRVLLWLLVWPGALLARDPFQPPAEAACARDVPSLNAWRLQGIIGNRQGFSAWLISPQGAAVQASFDRPFPVSPWRIVSVSARKLVLVAEKSCTPQVFSFQLKGQYRDMESHFAYGAGGTDALLTRQ